MAEPETRGECMGRFNGRQSGRAKGREDISVHFKQRACDEEKVSPPPLIPPQAKFVILT